MYYMILAAMITNANPDSLPMPMPMIIESYVSLEKCRDGLVLAREYENFKLIKHLMFGKSAVKQYGEEGVTLLFCVKDMRSV